MQAAGRLHHAPEQTGIVYHTGIHEADGRSFSQRAAPVLLIRRRRLRSFDAEHHIRLNVVHHCHQAARPCFSLCCESSRQIKFQIPEQQGNQYRTGGAASQRAAKHHISGLTPGGGKHYPVAGIHRLARFFFAERADIQIQFPGRNRFSPFLRRQQMNRLGAQHAGQFPFCGADRHGPSAQSLSGYVSHRCQLHCSIVTDLRYQKSRFIHRSTDQHGNGCPLVPLLFRGQTTKRGRVKGDIPKRLQFTENPLAHALFFP